MTEPQWTPPSTLTDPYVDRIPVRRVDWSRASRGRIRGGGTQSVAWRLADYANAAGVNAHPGASRLGRDIRTSEKTARRALAWLVEAGWIRVTRHGNRQLQQADTYQLTLPAPVAAELGRWPAEEPQWIERPATAPSGAEAGDGAPLPCPPLPTPRVRSPMPDIRAPMPDISAPKPDTGVHPPGPIHQGLSTSSGVSNSAPPASRRRAAKIANEDELIDALDAELGPLGYHGERLLDAMLAEGRPFKAIFNAVVAQEG